MIRELSALDLARVRVLGADQKESGLWGRDRVIRGKESACANVIREKIAGSPRGPPPLCWSLEICRVWVFLSLFFPEVSEVLLIFSSYYQQI